MNQHWNERYSQKEFVYGSEPNRFFKNELKKLKPGKILLPGDGEGRNGVFAATLGWNTDAVDFSEVGKRKALQLAEEFNVTINYLVDDITTYPFQKELYDAAALIFIHLPEESREHFHKKIIDSLKPAGKIILELFEKEQLKRNSGGPKDESLLYSLEDIITDFHELEIEHFSKEIVYLDEGEHHQGEAVVVRFVGIKT